MVKEMDCLSIGHARAGSNPVDVVLGFYQAVRRRSRKPKIASKSAEKPSIFLRKLLSGYNKYDLLKRRPNIIIIKYK